MDPSRPSHPRQEPQPPRRPGAPRRAADGDGAPAGAAGLPRFLRAVTEAAAEPGPPSLSSSGLAIQRAPVDGSVAAAAPVGVEPAGAAAESGAPVPVPGMIVDDAAEPAAGQMRKSEFLALLRGEVCHAAEEALAGTPWSTVGCPYVDRWVEHYAAQDAASVEQALHRHVPGARGAASARDYVPLVAARVRTAVGQWTGQGGEAPEGVAGAEDGAPGGGLISRFVGLFFKGREGAGRADGSSPEAVRARLGRGESLDAGVASRMGSALGRDFSRVRVHTDARAASLSTGMAARAFTVGEHVAFGAGEYRPGTPVGDALIAHELAHVAQQEGASAAAPPGPGSGVLEEEADRSAVGAVSRLWGGAAELAGRIGADALPALRTGLRLQRCRCSPERPVVPLLTAFEAHYPDAVALIRASEHAMALVADAEAAGVVYGGYAEDGPGNEAWPYTIGNAVYVPKGRDAVMAMNAFLFELNNAIRAPRFAAITEEAQAGSITGPEYARRIVEQEVEGMLRLGEVWFHMRSTDPAWSRYDAEFYQTEYDDFHSGRKTRDDIIQDVLQRTYPHTGITVEQNYINQYKTLRP